MRSESDFAKLLTILLLLLLFQWPNHGGGIENRREAKHERQISLRTAATFTRKWTVDTEGDVTATPAIADGVVYFTTWAGEVFAVREDDGKPLWRKNLTQELHSQELSSSRTTPVVHKQYLFVGINGPALQLALDRGTGNLLWSTQLDPHPDAVISCSGTVFERCTQSSPLSTTHHIRTTFTCAGTSRKCTLDQHIHVCLNILI